jgi:hypothetical protein
MNLLYGIIVYIVAKPADQRGFQVHPQRWVIERTLAWLMMHRRLVRDYERRPPSSEEMPGGRSSARCYGGSREDTLLNNPDHGRLNSFDEAVDQLSTPS